MSKLTHAEFDEFWRWANLEELVHENPTPERRRLLLSTMDTCPCCQRWLGHNNPPADTDDVEQKKKKNWWD
jgi:hypothetical protein